MGRKSWLAVAAVVVALVSLAFFISVCGGSEEAGEEPTATQAPIAVPTATELAGDIHGARGDPSRGCNHQCASVRV